MRELSVCPSRQWRGGGVGGKRNSGMAARRHESETRPARTLSQASNQARDQVNENGKQENIASSSFFFLFLMVW
ncbi:hypothetical protein, unlikely [Trypanosoma brucei brucei TREU927]|uniref:Uncharacterized protein n=1 Tax=Trypanosoma brucei brucei (strain 927/4 GUTat10.1) TaxID=185431 RepID=Q4GYP0_TRYB2|nr:hypothetical protein, unlikely [Trypanosoma brucei brucei TREU927]CAJ16544.1 hypothetical protein, unlikely [Trypanosoma brucei brucei TREU927]